MDVACSFWANNYFFHNFIAVLMAAEINNDDIAGLKLVEKHKNSV